MWCGEKYKNLGIGYWKRASSPCFWSTCWLVPEDQWTEPSVESTEWSHRSPLTGYPWANPISMLTEKTKYDENIRQWLRKIRQIVGLIINNDDVLIGLDPEGQLTTGWIWPARSGSWLDLLECWSGRVRQCVEHLVLWSNAATRLPWLLCILPKHKNNEPWCKLRKHAVLIVLKY